MGRAKLVQQGGSYKEQLHEGKWKSNNYRNDTPESKGVSKKSRSKVVDEVWKQAKQKKEEVNDV